MYKDEMNKIYSFMRILTVEGRIVIKISHFNYNRMKTLAKYLVGVYNAAQRIPLGGMHNFCGDSLGLAARVSQTLKGFVQ